ncbi:MAG: H-type small acid-soluble spore protein [Bacillota bacterium]
MNLERARQIIQSEETIKVLFDGSPVWIENLNAKGNKAIVRTLDEARNVLEVPVTELVEASPSLFDRF